MEVITKNRVKVLSVLLVTSIIILIWLLVVLTNEGKALKGDGAF